jgi:hypothetical protein
VVVVVVMVVVGRWGWGGERLQMGKSLSEARRTCQTQRTRHRVTISASGRRTPATEHVNEPSRADCAPCVHPGSVHRSAGRSRLYPGPACLLVHGKDLAASGVQLASVRLRAHAPAHEDAVGWWRTARLRLHVSFSPLLWQQRSSS